MPNDINNLDTEDLGLKAIMGERFHDETAQQAQASTEKKATANTVNTGKAEQKTASKPRKKEYKDAEWEPVEHEPTQMDRIKECAKSALLFGGLSLLFFYFQQSGQMAITASMPCICACVALAGFGIGKNAAKGCR